jgi:hypothetical protein
MSIILNLGISDSFQTINYGQLRYPGKMLIDYVRVRVFPLHFSCDLILTRSYLQVYQREGSENVGCDPPGMPTSDYINK